MIHTIEWDSSSRKDIDSGFLYATKFSKPSPSFIVAGGAGKNEVKIFENNIEGQANFKLLASILDLDSPCLSIETSKQGDSFAFGC